MVALDDTLGVLLIGVLVAAVLYGFTLIQTWFYFTRYPSDPWCIKLLVAAALITDTCHQALITHTIYTYLITNFGVFAQLENTIWCVFVEICLNAFTALLVQCFMAWRIYKLSNRSLLAVGSVMVLVIAGFLMSLIIAAKEMHLKKYAQLITLMGLSMSTSVVAAAGDIYIAVLLCYLLFRSRTGFRRSDTMLRKLILFSINTGLLTSVCALSSLVAIALGPDTFIYAAFYYNIGRLYCNALLATLNMRRELRGECDDDCSGSMSISLQGLSSQKTNSIIPGKPSRRMTNSIAIKVDTTKEFVQDEHPSSSENLKADAI